MSKSPKPWYHPLTLDLLLRVARRTFLHPFVAWMIPLCQRAQATPYTHLSIQITIAYASFLTILSLLSMLNQRLVFGEARKVELEDEVVVIAGGCGGVGRLVAGIYAMRGVGVAVLDLVPPEGLEGVEFYQCDVGNWEQVAAAAKGIEEDLGTPTILINTVARTSGLPLLSLPASTIESSLRTNLLSAYIALKTFLPSMLTSENGGTIVTISSTLAHLPCINTSDYAPMKAALSHLHSCVQAELSAHPDGEKVKTLLFTPGQISTPLFAGVKTPSPFFAPELEPKDLAAEIVRRVDSGEGGEWAGPEYARWLFLWDVLPRSVRGVARKWAGMDGAMRGFRGRDGGDEGEKKGE